MYVLYCRCTQLVPAVSYIPVQSLQEYYVEKLAIAVSTTRSIGEVLLLTERDLHPLREYDIVVSYVLFITCTPFSWLHDCFVFRNMISYTYTYTIRSTAAVCNIHDVYGTSLDYKQLFAYLHFLWCPGAALLSGSVWTSRALFSLFFVHVAAFGRLSPPPQQKATRTSGTYIYVRNTAAAAAVTANHKDAQQYICTTQQQTAAVYFPFSDGDGF